MKKRVLIVGGAGYIGGYLTDFLLKEEYDVCVYDLLLYETRYLKNVNFVYGDIRDTNLLLKTAEDYDVIVLSAALVGDSACSINIDLSDSINHQAIKNFCKKVDTSKHLIFFSTCSVYGAQYDVLDENSKTNPLSVYASTKLLAEQYVLEKNGTVFRLGTVYGIGDQYSRIRLDLVVNTLVANAVFYKKIHIFGGEQWRPLICVKDIAGFVEEAIRRNIRGLFILSENNYTMKMLADLIKKVFPEVVIEFTSILYEDARNYRVNTKKMKSTFKYIPKHNIIDEILVLKKLFEEHRIVNINDYVYNNGKYIKNNLNLII